MAEVILNQKGKPRFIARTNRLTVPYACLLPAWAGWQFRRKLTESGTGIIERRQLVRKQAAF
jgi:hypothetical protein